MNYELPVRDGGTVEYELIDFPFVPTLLTRATVRADGIEGPVRWLERELLRRVSAGRSVFRRLGAPAVSSKDPRAGLRELGQWVQEWFPVVAEPFMQRSYPSEPSWERKWLQNWSHDRLGNVVASWPHQDGYSKLGDTLLHTLVVDLAALVMELVPEHGPPPQWAAEAANHQLLVVARPGTPPFAPLSQIRELLLQSAGPVRGERSRSLRRRQSEILVDCFDQAVTGKVPTPAELLFPENRSRHVNRFPLKLAPRSAPPARTDVLDSVAALRRVGFYQSWHYSDDELARAVQVAWANATGRSLPPKDLWTPLILLDSERTWFEDVDVQIQGVSDQMYREVVFSLQKIGGPGFGSFSDPEEDWEDWRSSPATVQFNLRWRRKGRNFSLPRTRDGVITPTLFAELNALLPVEASKLHYLDIGPTIAVVMRLNEDERRHLGQLTSLDILTEPPRWWVLAADQGLSSIPPDRTDPLLIGTPLAEAVMAREEPSFTAADRDELRGVSVTDMDLDGEIVFNVFVSAAEFIRGGDVEDALEDRVTTAILSVPGVTETLRADREVWQVIGELEEADLETAVRAAVLSVLTDYSDEISASLS